MRIIVRNFVALLLILFVAKVAMQAENSQEQVALNKLPKSLLLASVPKGEMIPTGHIKTATLVKTLNAAALQKGI